MAAVSLSKLLAVLVALALFLAPSGSMAMEPLPVGSGGHHAGMAASKHCNGGETQADHGEKASQGDCCIAMCGGLALNSSLLPSPLRFERPDELSSVESHGRSWLFEIATPPPKLA